MEPGNSHFYILLRIFIFFPLSGIPIILYAQICSGSLGDPAVNITFSQNSNLNYSAPGYTYTPSSCPNDGFYTITGSTSNCFGNTWHTVATDHTGGGGFLLVNATVSPGDFFVASVTDLCPNTTYEFAAWLINVVNWTGSILPDITFKIEKPDGTILQSFNTGGIPVTASPVWKQYGFFFTTPATNAVIVLRMTNNAPGGAGNDIAIDDITFRPCGSRIDAAIQGLATNTVNECEGYNKTYTFYSNVAAGYNSPLFQWQQSVNNGTSWTNIPGATSLSYTLFPLAKPNDYLYRLTVIESAVAQISSCRIASEILYMHVHEKPLVDAGPDRVTLKDYPVTINARAEGDQVQFRWTPVTYLNDTGSLTPTVIPRGDITYTLSAVTAAGCTDKDEVLVKVVERIFVPNAFTPNQDGVNDIWHIPYLDPSFEAEVSVYNRWGQRVYHINNSAVNWDGSFRNEPQPSGVYVYMINFKKRKFPNMKGTLLLIR